MNYKEFKQLIWNYYKKHKRSFPWRQTKNPYHILVSEIMLQQTQTERVKIKYEEWLKAFPTLKSLAQAPLQKVLENWQGLGYNRRALALQKTAKIIVEQYSGKFPSTYPELLELPGIGPYTAGAVMAFAFNKPHPIIETNIRTVFIHFFFPKNHGQIHDQEILKLVEKTLPQKDSAKLDPRNWYYALMDYGVMLKKTLGNLNVKSRHYTKQSKFKGSNREIRAAVVRAVTKSSKTQVNIFKSLELENIKVTQEQLKTIILKLCDEGFMKKVGQKYVI